MCEKYYIQRVKQPKEDIFETIPKASLNYWYPTETADYKPKTYGQICRSSLAWHINMVCEETQPYAVQTMPNSPVCTDSCMEFFLNLQPEDNTFINFEINAIGTMLLGINQNGNFRCLDPALQRKCFVSVKVDNKAGLWQIRLCIPNSLLQSIFTQWNPEGTEPVKGNFYKCGDDTKKPHYGSWNPVARRPIDFHCPECFGEFIY